VNRESNAVGATVRHYRCARGMSQRAMAADLRISPATLCNIESGKVRLSVVRLHAIAEVLGVPASRLLEAPPTAKPTNTPPVATVGSWRMFEPMPTDDVLSAAIRAFVATGYHGSTMRAIAELAGLSVAGVYHHYQSKQEILVHILSQTMEDLLFRVTSARDEGSTSEARLGLMVEALALYHTRRREVSFIGASEMRSLEPSHYQRIAGMRNEVQRMFDAEIRTLCRESGVATDDVADTGKAIVTMCTALAQWFHDGGPRTAEQIAWDYSRLALRMLVPASDIRE
jgi:AcrR family transcriptional regulator